MEKKNDIQAPTLTKSLRLVSISRLTLPMRSGEPMPLKKYRRKKLPMNKEKKLNLRNLSFVSR